ncbi:MAG: amidase [Betaproteobacteria bacterium]|jgi:aspartyl-tRNA(Asn)/glutamyl-tRNA(Gln) amidotransferase subunit A
MELWRQSITSLARGLRSGKLSAVELTRQCLERIHVLDPKLLAFTHVSATAEAAALDAEREIRAGRWRGALHGIPVAIKDNYLTADMPTTAGTEAPGIAFPQRDSAAAARLRGAGAILIGKTRTHEFAWGNVTPPTRNPWDLDRVPSGSSGGSGAAVAAGLCPAGMGSDTGGSIRMPAAVCGTVGIKPTFGRVSRDGIVPHSWSLDHPGPLTRTVADAALLMNILAGYDPADPACQDRKVPDYSRAIGKPVTGLRVGVCRNHFFDRNDPDVDRAVEAAIASLARAGATIHEFTIPRLEYGLAAIFAIELASSTAYHDVSLRAGRVSHYSADVRTLVEMGRFVTAADYLKAEQLRTLLMADFRQALDRVDVIVGPTMPITAWKAGTWSVKTEDREENALSASWRYTFPYNLTGLPAISVPCGFDRRGLPIGLQIAGRPFDETMVLRVADAYERMHDWKDRMPPL